MAQSIKSHKKALKPRGGGGGGRGYNNKIDSQPFFLKVEKSTSQLH